MAAAGAIWVGTNLYQMFGYQGEKENAARQTAQLTRQYQDVTRQFPAAPASADNLQEDGGDRAGAAQDLAHAGNGDGAGEPGARGQSERGREGTGLEVRGHGNLGRAQHGAARRRRARRRLALPGSPAPAAARKQSALIDGEIRPFNGDFRAAISTINEFAARLGKDPRVAEVRVVKLPLNVNPTQPLAGNTLDSPDQNATADFKLVLVLKPNV